MIDKTSKSPWRLLGHYPGRKTTGSSDLFRGKVGDNQINRNQWVQCFSLAIAAQNTLGTGRKKFQRIWRHRFLSSADRSSGLLKTTTGWRFVEIRLKKIKQENRGKMISSSVLPSTEKRGMIRSEMVFPHHTCRIFHVIRISNGDMPCLNGLQKKLSR